MKAIVCKYIGPSNVKGSRIKAYAEGGNSITIGYPHELSGSDVYRHAAELLCAKMKWSGNLIEGGLPNGDYVFTFAPDATPTAVDQCADMLGTYGFQSLDKTERGGVSEYGYIQARVINAAHDILLAARSTSTTREQFWALVQTEMATRKAA